MHWRFAPTHRARHIPDERTTKMKRMTIAVAAMAALCSTGALAQGGQDSPELRNAVRENLNTLSMLATEAMKKGLDKEPDIKTQLDLNSENILANVYVGDWLKKNPVPEADLKKDYDAAKAQMGDKEYKVRHILVDKEDEAKEIIAELQKGAKFADLAKERSKDPGSKDKGQWIEKHIKDLRAKNGI